MLAQPITGLQAAGACINTAMRSQIRRMVVVLAVTRTEQLRRRIANQTLGTRSLRCASSILYRNLLGYLRNVFAAVAMC